MKTVSTDYVRCYALSGQTDMYQTTQSEDGQKKKKKRMTKKKKKVSKEAKRQ